jgi:hypothetical protein
VADIWPEPQPCIVRRRGDDLFDDEEARWAVRRLHLAETCRRFGIPFKLVKSPLTSHHVVVWVDGEPIDPSR